MINESRIKGFTDECLSGSKVFVATITVRKGNRIMVLLDGEDGVIVDDCVRVSRFIESHLDRDVEDFELEVSSFGVGTPLVLPRQYSINVGRSAKVTMNDQTVATGVIVAAGENSFTLAVKVPPKKKEIQNREILYSDCSKTQIIVTFK